MAAHTIAKLQRSVSISFLKLNGQLHGSSTVRPVDQILHCDWLPKRAQLCKKISLIHMIINTPLIDQANVQSFSQDSLILALVFFAVLRTSHLSQSINPPEKHKLLRYPPVLTSFLVSIPCLTLCIS